MQSRDLRTISHALILVAFMLGLIAAALWLRGGGLEPVASAQYQRISTDKEGGIPDAGRQRMDIIAELQKINARLEGIDSGLRGGTYRIQTVEAKDGAKPAAEGAR